MVLRWSQQVTDGEVTVADDLATIVYREGHAVGTAEGAEIDHPARPRPREGVRSPLAGGVAGASGLSDAVPRQGPAEAGGGEVAGEIAHPTRRRPRERVRRRIARGVTIADDLAAGVHREGGAGA